MTNRKKRPLTTKEALDELSVKITELRNLVSKQMGIGCKIDRPSAVHWMCVFTATAFLFAGLEHIDRSGDKVFLANSIWAVILAIIYMIRAIIER